MKKILFVCLGNICRSSTAEGVMLHLIEEAGLEKEFVIDSAGILSYHQGELPDSRMRAHAARRGYQLVHRSRPVRTEDFYNFDLIIGMDDRNIEDLKDKAPSRRMEEDSPHDGILQPYPCRSCPRPLLWWGRRFRVCAGYFGRCLFRPAYFFNSG